MKYKFESWMKTKENKKQSTAYAYANSIDKISRHYSQHSENKIDIYRVKDIRVIERISSDYAIGGRFPMYGQEGNGTIRNAIATLLRFQNEINADQELSSDGDYVEEEIHFSQFTAFRPIKVGEKRLHVLINARTYNFCSHVQKLSHVCI